MNAYPKTNIIGPVLLFLLLIAFLFGVAHLFVLRFQTGDVYPAYSSLRSDPLGTRVFYESLKNLADIAPRRNHRLLKSFKPEPDTTFLYLGALMDDYTAVPQELIEVSDRLAASGGRLVVSFLAPNRKPEDKTKREKEAKSRKVDKVETRECSKKNDLFSISSHWGIKFEFNQDLPVKDGSYLALDAVSNRVDLPPVISWYSNLYFDLLDRSWQVIYRSNGQAVMIERRFGKGSLVLCADSFFISNEALQSERQPQLLVWLLGRHSNIIFDETHFGIYNQPSVAVLLRHYRFHWVFLALVVLALLFVWKNGVYFVPPRENEFTSRAEVVSDRDYTQGLISMLRRNISHNKILQVCGQEWVRTFNRDKRLQPETLEKVKELLRELAPSSQKNRMDAVKGYRTIRRIIQRSKKYE